MLRTNTQETNFRHTSETYDYRETLVASERVRWKVEDIIGGDKKLDFSKRFMPESLARVDRLLFLDENEKLILNQIRGHTYLSIFVIVEEFIVPYVLDHIRPTLSKDDDRTQAFLQFVGEEVKHIQLFKAFCEEFRQNFGTECKVIGPASEIGAAVLSHEPLSVALAILMIEWMTQDHYVQSVKDDGDIDPLFKSLLRNHWLEESQHAKLDTRMVEYLAEGLGSEAISRAVDGYFMVGAFLDEGLKQQTLLDLESLSLATGRKFTDDEQQVFIDVQLQANRWTYLGSGMVHPKFLQTMDRLGADQRMRVDSAAPLFS